MATENQFKCDNVTIPLPNEQLSIVKGWIDIRNDKISSLEEQKNALLSQIATLEKEKTKLKDEANSLQTNLDQQETNRKKNEEALKANFDALLSKRLKIRRTLEKKIDGKLTPEKMTKLDELSDRQIKELVILQVKPLKNLDQFSDAAIEGMFELSLSLDSNPSPVNLDNGLNSIKPQEKNYRQIDLLTFADSQSKQAFKNSFNK